MTWPERVVVFLSAWFALSLAVVGAWNAARWFVRRRSLVVYMAELEAERQGWR